MSSLIQSKLGSGFPSVVSFDSTIQTGNIMVAVPFKGQPNAAAEVHSTDPRQPGTCPVDSNMTVAEWATTNGLGSGGYNGIGMLAKEISGDTYSGPFSTNAGCDGASGNILVLEFDGAGVADAEVLEVNGVNSGTINCGTFADVGPDDILVMAAISKEDGYGGGERTITPNDFTEVLDGNYLTNGWVWVGYKIGDGVASIGAQGIVGGWAGIAVILRGAVAQPEPGVWIDWLQDGFDDGNGGNAAPDPDYPLARALPEAGGFGSGAVNDNITADCQSISWNRGAASDHVQQPPAGVMTIIVANDDGKYTPENTGSVLYGLLHPGLPVWCGRTIDGSLFENGEAVLGVWAGYVREIVPIPALGAAETPTAQIICEDPLSWYERQPVQVADAIGRSYSALRAAVLDNIGESADRRDLGVEPDTIPLSSAASDSALAVLEEINSATGARHWIEVGDTKEEWYYYTVRDRNYKLTSANDFTIADADVHNMEGYRVTEENVNNHQEIDVNPVRLPAGPSPVWSFPDGALTVSGFKFITAIFNDFVTDAVLDYTSSGTIASATITNYGMRAILKFWGVGIVSNLSIEGRQVIRDSGLSVVADDASSILMYGKRAGPRVSSEYSQSIALGQGLAEFLVWRFKTAHSRPVLEAVNAFASLNGATLYDTLGLTFDQLYLLDRRFEIIGEEGSCDLNVPDEDKVHWSYKYQLQETANQSPLNLFTLDVSALDGTDVLAY